MLINSSHDIHHIFEQLRAVDRRRSRIVDSVSAHFGRKLVEKILQRQNLVSPLFTEETELQDLFDEREPEDFIRSLALEVETYEARTVHQLRNQVSKYKEHVDEQILFGSRTAGQDAARTFLARSAAVDKRPRLPLVEAVQAIYFTTYNGLPQDRDYILSIRPLSDISAHFRRSPHLAAWQAAEMNTSFMNAIKSEWISGMLDVLNPEIQHRCVLAYENGEGYGLEEFTQSSPLP